MSGIGEAAISYEGRTDSISSKNSRLQGFLTFNQTDILVIGPQAILKNCRSRIRFENANLIVDSLNANLAGQPVYMQGQANNVLSLLSDDHVPVSLNWNIYAPVINLNSIQSILQRKISAATSAPAKKTKIGATIENIDHLLSSGRVTAYLRADRLQFQKMDARNFAADIFLEGNKWSVKKATLRHGDGSVLVTANVVELSPNQMKFSSTIDLKNLITLISIYIFSAFRAIPSISRIANYYSDFKFHSSSINIINKEFKKNKFLPNLFENNVLFNFKKIRISNLHFSYNKKNKLLNNISFDIKKGDKVCIIGQSGSGKTTLVNIILGLLNPTAGSIFIDNSN
jgi:ABC-type multidrug transport system fused ATPase/permease subunit